MKIAASNGYRTTIFRIGWLEQRSFSSTATRQATCQASFVSNLVKILSYCHVEEHLSLSSQQMGWSQRFLSSTKMISTGSLHVMRHIMFSLTKAVLLQQDIQPAPSTGRSIPLLHQPPTQRACMGQPGQVTPCQVCFSQILKQRKQRISKSIPGFARDSRSCMQSMLTILSRWTTILLLLFATQDLWT